MDAPARAATSVDAAADSGDWMASLRDLELTWNDATHAAEERPALVPDEWLQSLDEELETRADTAGTGTTAPDSPESAAWWHPPHDQDDAFDVDRVPASPRRETGDWIGGGPGDAPPVAEPSAKPSTAPVRAGARRGKRSRRSVALVAAAAVLFLGGATAVVALAGRSGGGRPTVKAATNASNNSSTRTTGVGATTSAPSATATPASTPPRGPRSFTVQATCGRRECTLEVRAGPGKVAQRVSDFHSGQVVQIDCYTHGEQVKDADTGQQSDLWYRYAGTNNYSSALYLQGPPVASC
jgi:hypothetical protein